MTIGLHSAWLTCLTAVLSGTALAFQPLVTDDTGTQGASGNQLEYGYTRFVEEEPLSKAITESHAIVYTRGLTDALDLYLGGSLVHFRGPAAPGESGAGSPVAGLKWRFHENEARKFSLAFRPEVRFAVSDGAEDRGLGNGEANASAALIATRETGFGAVHANLAYGSYHFALPGNRDIHRRGLWRVSVAPVFELSPQWKVALDAGLVTNPHRSEKAAMGYVEAGAIWSPNADLDFAFGLARDVRHLGHRVYLATGGITWRFR